MGKRWGAAVLVLLGLFAVGVWAERARAPQDSRQGPATEAMAWDRDFDLLLELQKAPTKDQVKTEELRRSLVKEREEVAGRLVDLKSRQSAVAGTFTTEALLNEMLLQGVADMKSVHENLRAWIARDEARVKEIDAKLQKLAAREGA